MASSTIIHKLIPSSIYSKSKTELFASHIGVKKLSIVNYVGKQRCVLSGSISCKAVSVAQPETEVEGLNIADDVTQVAELVFFLCEPLGLIQWHQLRVSSSYNDNGRIL
ncbi:hypothetical protein LIER_22750 [Lithospermum erythrorhizon]|uniref:Uncharacterized protein n=1 Tax=Lithospermum erythrorhizon TaxID=34254 RepID=A0AAV3QYD6_LITER